MPVHHARLEIQGAAAQQVFWLEPSAPGDHPALHLLSTLTKGWRQHVWNGYDMTSIDCFWPEGTAGAYYHGAVHFSSGEQWIEGTIIHEQGHHRVANFGIAIAPDYCNGICDSPSCGHCVWCQETDHDARAEGFPNWIGEWIPSTYPGVYGYAPGNAGGGRYMLEALGDCGVNDDPYRTENFLGALLHDVVDVPSDDHNGADAWRDRLNLAALGEVRPQFVRRLARFACALDRRQNPVALRLPSRQR